MKSIRKSTFAMTSAGEVYAASVVAYAVLLVMLFALIGCRKESPTEQAIPSSTGEFAKPPLSSSSSASPLPERPSVLQPASDVSGGTTGPENVPSRTSPVTFDEARDAYLNRRYEAATELFRQYAGRQSDNPWGHYMLGLSAWKSGDLAAAETALNAALDLDSTHTKARQNLVRVLLEMERHDEALAQAQAVLQQSSKMAEANRLVGRALHAAGRSDDAIEAYRTAIAIDETDAWSMNNLGLVLIEQGRFEDALQPLAGAIDVRDDIALFFNNYGIALERTGRFGLAEQAYRAALELEVNYERASDNLSRVEGVEDDDVAPVELNDLARAFHDSMQVWRDATAADAPAGGTDAPAGGTAPPADPAVGEPGI